MRTSSRSICKDELAGGCASVHLRAKYLKLEFDASTMAIEAGMKEDRTLTAKTSIPVCRATRAHWSGRVARGYSSSGPSVSAYGTLVLWGEDLVSD